MDPDIKHLPVTLHTGEEIVFISKYDYEKIRMKLIRSRILLCIYSLATLYIYFCTALSRWYVVLGIFLVLITNSSRQLYKEMIKEYSESKLFITTKRIIIRWVWKDKWEWNDRFNTCYIDNIVKVDTIRNGIWIRTNSEDGNQSLTFKYIDNRDEAMNILSPLVDQRHKTY